jgi:F-type H+-transporting ATPase subunit epsilon
MAKEFRLEVVTPIQMSYVSDVIHLRAPGVAGDFGVLADHAPMMAALKAGRLHVDTVDAGFDFAISGGYLEVHQNRSVIFAETCTRKEDIDLPRASSAKQRALKELEEATTPQQQDDARAALARALARIKVAEG